MYLKISKIRIYLINSLLEKNVNDHGWWITLYVVISMIVLSIRKKYV